MHLRCGGYDRFITRLLLSLMVKNFENRSTLGEVVGKSRVSCFLTPGVLSGRE